MILTFDMGNTRTKMAAFKGGSSVHFLSMNNDQLQAEVEQFLASIAADEKLMIGWMSVGSGTTISGWPVWKRFEEACTFVHVHSNSRLPIQNAYKTPETLGIDRIVAVIAARAIYPRDPVLVIDAGTALTYDVATADGVYLGGGISPGIRMRFRALHTFTAKLPLIEEIGTFNLIGNSTHASMSSGVLNGIKAEVAGICQQYREVFGPDLKIIFTGGDMSFFENQLKSANFADSNLTLKGLYYILKHNSTV